MVLKHVAQLLVFFTLVTSCKKNPAFKNLSGDQVQADTLIKVHPIEHGSLVLATSDVTIFVDPVQTSTYAGKPQPDIILVTDIHGDHMNKAAIEKLSVPGTVVIGPHAVVEKTGGKALANGEATTVSEVRIEAIPMYNLTEGRLDRHPRGRGNGYLLTLAGKRIYISGDTEDIPEMRKLKDIDIAFVCMNLPYTMTVEQAASAVNEFKPAIVYPFHYRGADGFSDVKKFADLVNSQLHSEVRLLDWYPGQKSDT